MPGLGTVAAEGVEQLLAKAGLPLRRAAMDFGAAPGGRADIGFVGRQLSGVRRYLERYAPDIPKRLDAAYERQMRADEAWDAKLNDLAKRSGIGPRDPRLHRAISAAEGGLDPAALTPQERAIYQFWDVARHKYAAMAGFPAGMDSSAYFPHLVEPANIPQLEAVLAGRAERATLSPADQFRLRATYAISTREGLPLHTALQAMTGTPQYLRDLHDSGVIPREVFNAFKQHRRGFPVWSKDFYDVARTYGRAMHRQAYLEPALQFASMEAEAKLPPNLKRELKSRIEHGFLRRPTDTEKLLQATWAPFQTWIKTLTGGRVDPGPGGIEKLFRSVYHTTSFWDIGFNPSPIKKHYAADMLSIFAELGGKYTLAGHYHAAAQGADSRAWRELARTVGNVRERIPEIEMFQDFMPLGQRGYAQTIRGLNKAAFYAYQKIDLLNQYTAWIGGYQKALAKGLAGPEAIEYANRITRYTVPRQTPLDLPGLLRSTPAKLAFQFSSKKMQRAELVWDQWKRFLGGDWSPFTRTLLATAVLTGLPLDEMFAKKTGLDPERLPVYDMLGKMGFGMRKVLTSFFPHLGPSLQLAADVARIGHDPSRLLERLSPIAFSGRDIYEGPLPGLGLPVGARSVVRLAQELREGQRRTRFGEIVAPSTTPNAIAHYLGFDDPPAVKATQQFAESLHQYHLDLGDASRAVSVLYYTHVHQRGDWAGFVAGLADIQRRFPDVEVTESLVNRAIVRTEETRAQRLAARMPRGFAERHPELLPQGAR